MEICVKCFFDNKLELEKAVNYLTPIVGCHIGRPDQTASDAPNIWAIESCNPITQDQLNELTTLCPIRPRRKLSREDVYSKIAYMIGVFGAGYHPEDDMLDHIDLEDPMREKLQAIQDDIDFSCDTLGLDPCAIALEVLTNLGLNPFKN